MEPEQIFTDIHNALAKWNERSSFRIAGVKNLSRADLDVALQYALVFINQGSIRGLMPPMGNMKELLAKYNIS